MTALIHPPSDPPSSTDPLQEIQRRLRVPFSANVVEWKPTTVSGNRALVCAYVDARAVMDRLDQVLGIGGWQDEYTVLDDGNVVCTLHVRIGGEWIAHEDVGGESDQKDDGDRRKSAFSDALKRAAVKVGIGRYLYRLPSQWVDFDPHKKQLVRTPALPDWALPSSERRTDRKERGGNRLLPANGAELLLRLHQRESALVEAGRCRRGELLEDVKKQASILKAPAKIEDWPADIIALTPDWVRTFEGLHPAAKEQSAAPSAPAPAARITFALANEMLDLLHRKGRSWKVARDWAGLPTPTMPHDISPDIYDRICAALHEMPDEEPREG